ncbi:MAG: hypothetical protein ACI9KE_001588 [Polyangiales bacterium]
MTSEVIDSGHRATNDGGMTNPRNERLVRSALSANALFSLLCGGALLLFSAPSATLSATLGATEFALLGASLLPFALVVAVTARGKPIRVPHVLVISSMDLIWVIATLVLGAAWPTLFTTQGWIAAALVALIIMVFCLLQLLGLR